MNAPCMKYSQSLKKKYFYNTKDQDWTQTEKNKQKTSKEWERNWGKWSVYAVDSEDSFWEVNVVAELKAKTWFKMYLKSLKKEMNSN